MASKSVLMAALYDQFLTFLEELSEMYPEDPDFRLWITGIRLLKNTNPSILVKYIHDNMTLYHEKIMNKDVNFFIENDFTEYSSYINMDVFGKLKGYIKNMSLESKESVWKYCQNIYRLGKACHELA